ncbi:MAG: AAA family ATPase [Oligoflexia bacterium]|nr:AAA family ATPase [Oligoflexia bacterium]
MIKGSVLPVKPHSKKRPSWAEKYLIYEGLLNERFIGQEQACRELAGIVASFINLMTMDKTIARDLLAPRVIISGGTSQGKTSMSMAIADFLNCPYSIINCGAITPEGYKGTNISDGLFQMVQSHGQEEVEAGSILIIDEFCKLIQRSKQDPFYQSCIYNLLGILGGEKILINPKDDSIGGPVLLDTKKIIVILCGIFKGVPQRAWSNQKNSINGLIKFGFPDELMGRISHIIALKKLMKSDVAQIVGREFEKIMPLYQTGKISFDLPLSEMKKITNEVYSGPLGIRYAKMLLHQKMYDVAQKTAIDDMFNP